MNSATTGDLETKNASDVAKHEFDGNPEENRDIVPPFTYNGQSYSENWDANGQAIFNAGCKGSTPPPTTTTTSEQQVTFCDMESATSGKLETKDASEVAKHEFDGNPEENRDIVPPFTLNGKTYSENWDAQRSGDLQRRLQRLVGRAGHDDDREGVRRVSRVDRAGQGRPRQG